MTSRWNLALPSSDYVYMMRRAVRGRQDPMVTLPPSVFGASCQTRADFWACWCWRAAPRPRPMRPAARARRPAIPTGRLSDNRWRVTFTGNSVTPRETVENYLLLRAAEVTLAAGHQPFPVRHPRYQRPHPLRRDSHGPARSLWRLAVIGYWRFHPALGLWRVRGPDVDIVSSTQYEVLCRDRGAERRTRPRASRAPSMPGR